MHPKDLAFPPILWHMFSTRLLVGQIKTLLETLTFGSLSTFGTRKLAIVAIPARDDKPCLIFLADRAGHGRDLNVPGTCGRHLALVEAMVLVLCDDSEVAVEKSYRTSLILTTGKRAEREEQCRCL